MERRQINWARSHDWFVRSVGNAVIVREVSIRNGQTYVRLCQFSSFASLYRWAGY